MVVWLLLPNGNPPGIGMELETESSVLDDSIVLLSTRERNGNSCKSDKSNASESVRL